MRAGDVIPYIDMCQEEGVNLQRGMNFRLRGIYSVILMSLRRGAPYADRIDDEGRMLIYEGHDISRRRGGPDPKIVDQPMRNPGGSLTQNGRFYKAALKYKEGLSQPEFVRVYEKIHSGIWVFNGLFKLIDAWQEESNARNVFKFKLEMTEETEEIVSTRQQELDHNRLIPAAVKLEVWKRDKGQCVKCRSRDNLHFDHIIPYSKGGSSLVAENIQLLCARHNIAKRNRIE
ncbi:MAG: HNH endonuclease [Candidatus Tritonobacter lacicola]|nr:HNH endonuclease [Candidatus Tritonobacter lacicola]